VDEAGPRKEEEEGGRGVRRVGGGRRLCGRIAHSHIRATGICLVVGVNYVPTTLSHPSAPAPGKNEFPVISIFSSSHRHHLD
jgi:hypothetical protein